MQEMTPVDDDMRYQNAPSQSAIDEAYQKGYKNGWDDGVIQQLGNENAIEFVKTNLQNCKKEALLVLMQLCVNELHSRNLKQNHHHGDE